jgi:phospholipid/cholesterol/gamma-HCH transport system substrate-binding protein
VTARMQRAAAKRRSDVVVGVLVILGAALGFYLAFARPEPLADRFKVRAVFTSVNGVRPGLTPVRVAGVEVGRVRALSSYRGGPASLVTMELEDNAPRLHVDATAKLRPRLFLEGNSFIALSPGSPGAPEAESGITLSPRQTTVAVTLPHVLGALDADTRAGLQSTLQSYGEALDHRPTPAENATHDPSVLGESAGQALNDALGYAARGLPKSAIVSDASTGQHPGDLRAAIDDFGRVAQALNDAGPTLPRMFASLRRTSAAFAAESEAVEATLRELPGALHATRTALRAVARAMPPAQALASATTSALPALPGAMRAGRPWLRQLRALLGPRELGGGLEQLVPATRELAAGARPFGDALRELGLLSRCSSRVLVPTANARIEDGPRTAGSSVWAEFLSAAVGAAGIAQTFDGNGFFLRGHPGGGTSAVATESSRLLAAPTYGNAIAPPLGTRPAAPRGDLPAAASVPCLRNSPPDVNGPGAAPGPADGGGR